MHIELTDQLRCPANHDEAFLVLIPDRMEGRQVLAGHLGCPVCCWSCAWSDSVPDFGGAPVPEGELPFDATAAVAMLGISGPGGWLALAGSAGGLAAELEELLPDVRLVAVNPPASVQPSRATSLIRSGTWPIKRHSMRGVICGADGGDPAAAVASVLPGLRAVVVGADPPVPDQQRVVASSPGIWVVRG